jgi:nitrate reductase gamma subunit
LDAWLEWARGPFFWAALTFMGLGLLRLLVITIWQIVRAMRRAGDKSLPSRQLTVATLKWLVPIDRVRNRFLFSLTTIAFHVSIILVPLLLAGHIALIKRGTGLSWPGLPNLAADVLTILAVAAALALIVQRATAKTSRSLSRFQDYAIPLVIAVPFVSGFLVMHPALNPFGYTATLLVHVMSANVVLILVPITKISHCVLLPLTQIVSEVAWHFPPDAGSKVGAALGKEGEPV